MRQAARSVRAEGHLSAGDGGNDLAFRPVELLLDVELREAVVHQDRFGVEDHVRVAADVDDRAIRAQMEVLAHGLDDVLGAPGAPGQPALRGSLGRLMVGT